MLERRRHSLTTYCPLKMRGSCMCTCTDPPRWRSKSSGIQRKSKRIMGTNKSFVDFISAFRCNNNISCQPENFTFDTHTYAHIGSPTYVNVCVYAKCLRLFQTPFSHSCHGIRILGYIYVTVYFDFIRCVCFCFLLVFFISFLWVFAIDNRVMCMHQIVPSGEDIMMVFIFILLYVNIFPSRWRKIFTARLRDILI